MLCRLGREPERPFVLPRLSGAISFARPPIDSLAEATWPAFQAVLGSPQAQAWMDTLLEELVDEYERIAR